jgi:DNA segregation ATPase FtsK/SpoIIIE, S-DNA-T family
MPPRKKRTTRRRAPVKRKVARRRSKNGIKFELKSHIAREIWGVFYLALAIVTILSIKNTFGIIGEIWVSILNPILGWGIYIIPGMFVLLSLMLFLSKKIKFGASRILGVSLMLMAVLSVLHLSVPSSDIHEVAVLGQYGGYTGFVTNFIFRDVLMIGHFGASVVFVAMFVISLLLTFQVSIGELMSFLNPGFQLKKVKREHKKIEKDDSEDNEIKAKIKKMLFDDESGEEIVIKRSQIGNDNSASSVPAPAPKNSEEEEMKEELKKEASKTQDDDYVWEYPSLDLLSNNYQEIEADDDSLKVNAERIKDKLSQFGIEVAMQEVAVGPTVIQYTLKPADNVKLSKITALKNDLALALAASAVRIEAPIPGRSLVGIEVPNDRRAIVHIREILESDQFDEIDSSLRLPLGRTVSGKPIIADLKDMPHLLIAGATGSGKSVGMNTFLISLLYQNSPKDLKMILIDPKRVELTPYNNIPHLLTPVITDPEKAAISLRWVVQEMTRRYMVLSDSGNRNIEEYNADEKTPEKLPRMVVVVDELADLMMAAGKEVEASICRIAQMARAVGIHLIIATQRPSVDVITGLIKANIPARIAFAVSSSIDSRVILDGIGAEDLLGKGDMLYLPSGMNKPLRVQGIFTTTKEVERVTNRVKLTLDPDYDEAIISPKTAAAKVHGVPASAVTDVDGEDSMYQEAVSLVIESRKASASFLQRRLKLGYARAARLLDVMEEKGVVGPSKGAKPRDIFVE